ncbi:hypothetical protein JHK84_055564 [Glycine max]|nr:hypothetical protein JHK84_055564 [Glycine max]
MKCSMRKFGQADVLGLLDTRGQCARSETDLHRRHHHHFSGNKIREILGNHNYNKLGLPFNEQKYLANVIVDTILDNVSIATTHCKTLEKFKEWGFDKGWGNIARRVKETMKLLYEVVYILDQVRALEEELLHKIELQVLDVKPQILMVSY